VPWLIENRATRKDHLPVEQPTKFELVVNLNELAT
jgi:hypothetical protein